MAGFLIPPANFGMVEEYLYRSGQPNDLNFPFLEQLNLKKFIYLGSEDPPQSFINWARDQEVEMELLGSDEGLKLSWNPMSEDVIIKALEMILDTRNYPLCLIDSVGRHRVGTVVGCLRKLQRWNLTSIFEEYRRYAGSKVRLLNEQFIELFDTDLVTIPSNRPTWL